jgi:hypothetical protein
MNQAGGEVVDLTIAGIIHSARTSTVPYTTPTATYVAITIDRDAMGCPTVTPPTDINDPVLMGLTVTPGTKPSLKVAPAWCTTMYGNYTAPIGNTIGQRTPSPLVTTSDGKTSDAIVWVMGGKGANTLYGVDGDTGAILYTGACPGGVNMWTVPIAVKGHIVVAAINGNGAAGNNPGPPVKGELCSWSVP